MRRSVNGPANRAQNRRSVRLLKYGHTIPEHGNSELRWKEPRVSVGGAVQRVGNATRGSMDHMSPTTARSALREFAGPFAIFAIAPRYDKVADGQVFLSGPTQVDDFFA